MGWHFVLQELPTSTGSPSVYTLGDRIGTVEGAHERRLSLSLNGIATASFQIRMDNPLAEEITSRKGDVFLKVYQDFDLRFIGDCTQVEEVGQEGGATLACTFASPLWRLQKRLVGATTAGDGAIDTAGEEIISILLDTANTSWDTGIREGTFASLYSRSVGTDAPWRFKPFAEALAELSATKVAIPGGFQTVTTYNLADGFPTGTVLQGRVLPTPGGSTTWTTITGGPTTDDFNVVSATAQRDQVADDAAWYTGRFAVAGNTHYTDSIVQVDFTTGAFDQAFQYQGVVARMGVSTANHALALVETNASGAAEYVRFYKSVSVTRTLLGDVSVGALTNGAWYTIRLQIDAAGNWKIWLFAQGGSPGSPVLSGNDTVLATGGALAAGRPGFYDAQSVTGAALRTRNYDNFFHATYDPLADLQGLDFEIAPVEPVIDATGVQIATMNVSEQLGTTKDFVFEYGGGSHSAKSYRRVIDREGLLNRAWSLPNDFPTDTDFKSAIDMTSVNARGLFEEVITSDTQNDDARQALCYLTVAVRGVPRETITFEPSSTAPSFGDYEIGDIVTARAIINGIVRFNVQVRVYGFDLSIDDEGKETEAPRLVQE